MKLTILTPLGSQEYPEINEIILPTKLGEIAVLPHHEKLVAELVPGTIEVKTSGKTDHFASFGGFAKITGEEVKIFSAGVEHADTLDEAKIQESVEQAKKIKESAASDTEFAAAAAAIERELAKLKTIRRRRSK